MAVTKGKGSGQLPPQATTSRPQTQGKSGGSGTVATKTVSKSGKSGKGK
jgi:hypothetical protein